MMCLKPGNHDRSGFGDAIWALDKTDAVQATTRLVTKTYKSNFLSMQTYAD